MAPFTHTPGGPASCGCPSLCGRPSDGHTTHRWSDADGNHWVCWDSPVTSLTEMQSVSRLWADSVQEYIATGKRFG